MPLLYQVILTAGGTVRGSLAEAAGSPIKAMLRVGGETLLQRTVTLCKNSGRVRRLVLVGAEELASEPAYQLAEAMLTPGLTAADSMLRALDYLEDPTEPVLVVATDLPQLTWEAVEEFAAQCPKEAELCVPFIGRDRFEAAYPRVQQRYFRMRDGEFTVGGVLLATPRALIRNRTLLEQLYLARDNPLSVARLLGLMQAARYMAGSVSLADAERSFAQALQTKVAAVVSGTPSLAFDVELPGAYELACGAA